MRQPPTGLIVDDREIVHRARTSRGPRLQALAGGVVVVGLVVAAAIGPRPGPAASGGSSAASHHAALATAVATPPAIPTYDTLDPWPPVATQAPELRLPTLRLPKNVAAVPLPETAQPLELAPQGLFFRDEDRIWLADLRGAARPRAFASMLLPCSIVATASAAGSWFAYVEITPTVGRCDETTGDLSWRVQLVDTKHGKTRTVSAGTWRGNSEPPWAPIVAVDEDSYAITASEAGPDGAADSTNGIVEIRRSSDDRHVWSMNLQGAPQRLLLRRTGVFFESFDGGGENQVGFATQSTAGPTVFGAGTMAVSGDGTTVAWLERDPTAPNTAFLGIGRITAVGLEMGPMAARTACGDPASCFVFVDRVGARDYVAWQPMLGDDAGIGIVTDRWPAGALIALPTRPGWVGVVGSRLVWFDRSSSGLALRVLDLDDRGLVEAPAT